VKLGEEEEKKKEEPALTASPNKLGDKKPLTKNNSNILFLFT
jgi:hypothetical protein